MAQVMTIRGFVDADDLGLTLMHEHLFVNMIAEYREGGCLNDYPLVAQEVQAFAGVGGRTIVDVTTAEITRGASPDPGNVVSGRLENGRGHAEMGSRSTDNVLTLRELSDTTGLNIVMSTGHYRDPYFDDGWFDRHDATEIAELMVRDIEEGVADTNARAGIIGEIGADAWYISAAEERSFRAAARAQLRTGVAITTHAARWPVGINQLDLLCAEGVDPSRVVIGHCDTVNIPRYHEELASRGAFVQFDTIRGTTPYDHQLRVNMIVHMVKSGYINNILLSHDICRRSQYQISGAHGYALIPTVFSEMLLEAGMSSDELHQVLVHNPRRALSGKA